MQWMLAGSVQFNMNSLDSIEFTSTRRLSCKKVVPNSILLVQFNKSKAHPRIRTELKFVHSFSAGIVSTRCGVPLQPDMIRPMRVPRGGGSARGANLLSNASAHGVNIYKCHILPSHPSWPDSRAMKVFISDESVRRALSKDFWPDGIWCRKWQGQAKTSVESS